MTETLYFQTRSQSIWVEVPHDFVLECDFFGRQFQSQSKEDYFLTYLNIYRTKRSSKCYVLTFDILRQQHVVYLGTLCFWSLLYWDSVYLVQDFVLVFVILAFTSFLRFQPIQDKEGGNSISLVSSKFIGLGSLESFSLCFIPFVYLD